MKKVFFLFSIVWIVTIRGQNSFSTRINHSLESKIDSIVQAGIQNKAYPGAQVLIFKQDSVRLNKSYGFHTYDSIVRVEIIFVRPCLCNQNFSQYFGLYEVV